MAVEEMETQHHTKMQLVDLVELELMGTQEAAEAEAVEAEDQDLMVEDMEEVTLMDKDLKMQQQTQVLVVEDLIQTKTLELVQLELF